MHTRDEQICRATQFPLYVLDTWSPPNQYEIASSLPMFNSINIFLLVQKLQNYLKKRFETTEGHPLKCFLFGYNISVY